MRKKIWKKRKLQGDQYFSTISGSSKWKRKTRAGHTLFLPGAEGGPAPLLSCASAPLLLPSSNGPPAFCLDGCSVWPSAPCLSCNKLKLLVHNGGSLSRVHLFKLLLVFGQSHLWHSYKRARGGKEIMVILMSSLLMTSVLFFTKQGNNNTEFGSSKLERKLLGIWPKDPAWQGHLCFISATWKAREGVVFIKPQFSFWGHPRYRAISLAMLGLIPRLLWLGGQPSFGAREPHLGRNLITLSKTGWGLIKHWEFLTDIS